MVRLIDANALKDRFKLRINWLEKDKHDEYTIGIWDGCLYDTKLIDEAPTVDAVEVVHGRWTPNIINKCGIKHHYGFNASCCRRWSGSMTAYCPNCGAKMDLEDEE